MHIYDYNNNIFDLDEFNKIAEKAKQLNARLEKLPIFNPMEINGDENLVIDDLDCVKSFIENYKIKLNKSLGKSGANLYLLACYFSSTPETIDYLIDLGTEINRIDLFGNNAIISIVLNGNMSEKTKLQTIQMLIDKGCDVNWHNANYETALYISIKTLQLDIANLLIDNGANDIC